MLALQRDRDVARAPSGGTAGMRKEALAGKNGGSYGPFFGAVQPPVSEKGPNSRSVILTRRYRGTIYRWISGRPRGKWTAATPAREGGSSP
jgi:hypothetical protein